MRQQINLYQPIFSEQRKPLSFRMVGVACLLVLAGLTAYSIHTRQQLAQLEASVDALRMQHAEHKASLPEQPASTNDDIQARVKSLEHALEIRRVALQVLQSGGAGQTVGFASRMEALARRHIDGLWIDRLTLSGTNGSMSLSGVALDPDIVPVYLHNLARDSVLSGTRFDDFVIERPSATVDSASPDAAADTRSPRASTPQPHVRFRAGSKALLATNNTENAT